MTLPVYETYAIKYGERVGTRGTIFMKGDPHETPMAMDYQMVSKSMLTGLTRWTTIQMTMGWRTAEKSLN